jgi:hypothetical protein
MMGLNEENCKIARQAGRDAGVRDFKARLSFEGPRIITLLIFTGVALASSAGLLPELLYSMPRSGGIA